MGLEEVEWSQAAGRQEDTLTHDAAVCFYHIAQVRTRTNRYVLCRTDYVLTQDKSFKKWAKAYADDEALWFKEYVTGHLLLAATDSRICTP